MQAAVSRVVRTTRGVSALAGPVSRSVLPALSFPAVTFCTLQLDDLLLAPDCVKQLERIAARPHVEGDTLKLRVAVNEGGCSGFEYAFDMDHAPAGPSDTVFSRGGARVVVDATSLDWLRGSTIGFEDEMVGQRFVVMNNPNSASGCGCGASFAPKEEALGVSGSDEDSDSDDE